MRRPMLITPTGEPFTGSEFFTPGKPYRVICWLRDGIHDYDPDNTPKAATDSGGMMLWVIRWKPFSIAPRGVFAC